MKKIILAVTLLSLAVSFTTAQKTASVVQKPDSLKQVKVTAQAIARQPAGKSYLIDLTRKGAIYTLATGIDYSRVRVRTAMGDVTVAELVRKSGKTVSGKLLFGTPGDLRVHQLSLAPATNPVGKYSCNGTTLCTCKSTLDCIDMFGQKLCSGTAWCDDSAHCWCLLDPMLPIPPA